MSKNSKSPKAPSPYPAGWTRARVEAVARHYEDQSDDQAIADAEAAYSSTTSTMMQVPLSLVPAVERLISEKSR